MEWTKRETLKFIELWQEFPCLWNSKSNDFKNKQKRRDTLCYIAEQMGTDSHSCEKKILSLRTQFNREINKLKSQLGAGQEEIAQSNWYAFEHLLFLKDINVLGSSADPLLVVQTENEQQDVDLMDEIDKKSKIITMQQFQPGSMCKRKHDRQVRMLNLPKDSHARIVKRRKDEFSIFADTIASELREIKSKRHLLTLKKEIMELVFKTKLEIFDSENTEKLVND